MPVTPATTEPLALEGLGEKICLQIGVQMHVYKLDNFATVIRIVGYTAKQRWRLAHNKSDSLTCWQQSSIAYSIVCSGVLGSPWALTLCYAHAFTTVNPCS